MAREVDILGMFIRGILKGKSLLRISMNQELRSYILAGRVLDIGGGLNPSYLRFFKKVEPLDLVSLDFQAGDKSRNFDLESTTLPYGDNSIDQALLFNILEHIYNHVGLTKEVCRVLKPGGKVFGFVPFLVGYHPDPHDYFRYTPESLEKIFADSGFAKISMKPVGGGPFAASYNILMTYFPRVLRLLAWPGFWFLDKIFLRIKPGLAQKFPLGYFFILEKDK